MNLCSKTFSVNLVCFPEVSDCSSHFNMLVMNPPLPLKTFSKLQGHQLATRLIHVVWKLQSNSSYYDGGPIFCPRVNCKVEKETRSLRFTPSTQTYRESCKNIPARLRERLAELLRRSAFCGWTVAHFEGDCRNVTGLFLHNNVHMKPCARNGQNCGRFWVRRGESEWIYEAVKRLFSSTSSRDEPNKKGLWQATSLATNGRDESVGCQICHLNPMKEVICSLEQKLLTVLSREGNYFAEKTETFFCNSRNFVLRGVS